MGLNVNNSIHWPTARAVVLVLLLGGCSDRTVVVMPEEGGLLPPPNPPTAAEIKPEAIPAGQKSWLNGQALPLNTWFAQYLNGRCIGFSQVTIAKSETQGSNLVRLTKRDVLEVAATTTNPIQRRQIVLESLELPDGRFMSYTESSSIDDKTVSETSAVLQRESLATTKSAGGSKTVSSLKWPTGVWGPLGTTAILRQQPMQPGDYRTAQIFVPPLNKIVKVEFKGMKWELTTLPGGVVSELLLVETQFETDDGVSLTKNWVNKAGEIVKSVSPGGFSMFRTSPEDADRIDNEIRVAQLIAVKVPVRVSDEQLRSEHLTLLIDSENIDPFGVLSSKVNQQAKSLSALGAELTIHRVGTAEPIPEGITQDQPDKLHLAKFTADARKLQKFLKEFPDTSGTALSTVSQLTEGVFRKLKKVPLSRHFSTATQAINQLAGDCKAHAVLLVAALRERDIPARAASGLLIRKEGEETAATYHMWCEAWIDDRWLPLDPFAGSVGVGVDHIKFLESSLDEKHSHSAILPVLLSMKRLTITAKP